MTSPKLAARDPGEEPLDFSDSPPSQRAGALGIGRRSVVLVLPPPARYSGLGRAAAPLEGFLFPNCLAVAVGTADDPGSFLERRPSSVLGTSPSPPTLSSQASPPATPSNNSEIKTLFDNALNKREGWSLSVNSLNTMATKGNDLAKLAVVLLYRVGTAGLEIDETTAASYLSAGLSVLSSFQGKGICDYWDGLPILQQLRA